MEIRLTYTEISELIERKTGRSLPMCYGGSHTVRISYEVNMFIKTANVDIELTVDEIVGSDIYISYAGGAGIDFMIRQAIGMVKNRPGGEFIEPLDGNRILLALSRASQAGSLLDKVELQDICFDEQYAIVRFKPKV